MSGGTAVALKLIPETEEPLTATDAVAGENVNPT